MEKCDEYFEKHCVIEYKKMAEDEEVEVCNEILERNCDTPGPTVSLRARKGCVIF